MSKRRHCIEYNLTISCRTREEASKLSEEENEYTFNLDLRDGIEEYKDKRYTVCAYRWGEDNRPLFEFVLLRLTVTSFLQGIGPVSSSG